MCYPPKFLRWIRSVLSAGTQSVIPLRQTARRTPVTIEEETFWRKFGRTITHSKVLKPRSTRHVSIPFAFAHSDPVTGSRNQVSMPKTPMGRIKKVGESCLNCNQNTLDKAKIVRMIVATQSNIATTRTPGCGSRIALVTRYTPPNTYCHKG